MSVGQTISHKTQALKDRGTEPIGRTTRNRRLQRHGRTDQISGNLKQSGDNAKDGFKVWQKAPRAVPTPCGHHPAGLNAH